MMISDSDLLFGATLYMQGGPYAV